MSQNPADRYQSGAELIDALRGGRSARRAVHSRQYRRLLVIASVMSVLALAIGAGLRRWTITHQAIAKSTVQVLRVDPPVGTVLSRATLATGVPIRVTIQTQGSDPGEGHEAYLRLMANSSSFLQDAGGPVNGLRSWMIAETRAPFGETQLSLAGTLTVKHIASDGRIHLSLTRWVMGKSPADATFSVEYSLEFEVGR